MTPFGVLSTGLIGLLIFLYGFLPINIAGRKNPEDRPLPADINGVRVNSSLLFRPVINHLVLLVIDALREDFVADSEASIHMPYLSSVIHRGEGVLFTSLVEPPTVTLPRIKAITMGTIPNYADVVLNVLEKDVSGLKEDSIIRRASLSHFKMIFFGDDTWLHLFPESFVRAEGTSSFYVSDFTEVDNNVTRHLDQELKKDDWDFMILHYLGLDHIGHIHGPYSHLVPLKLLEMDHVIQKLHHGLMRWGSSTLLVVCGDHGMKDTGGHGGATYSETRVPLAFISPIFSQSHGCHRKSNDEVTVINQRDLAPTLSALLGLPPPSGNLGHVLPTVLQCFLPSLAAFLYALHVNAWQVAGLLNSSGASHKDGIFLYEEASKLHSEWIISETKRIQTEYTYEDQVNSSQMVERIAQLYSSSVSEMTSRLAESLVKFDYYAMLLGGFITWQAFLTLLLNGRNSVTDSYIKKILLLAILMLALHIIFCATGFCFTANSSFCKQDSYTFVYAIILAGIIAFNTCKILHRVRFFTLSNIKEKCEAIITCPLHCLLVVGGLLHAVSFTSSSFVEEEHQTWQFLCMSLIVLHAVIGCRSIRIGVRKSNDRIVSTHAFVINEKKSNSTMSDGRSKDSGYNTKSKTIKSINNSNYSDKYDQSAGDTFDNQEEIYKLITDSAPKRHCCKYINQDQQIFSNQTKYIMTHIKTEWFQFLWTFVLLLFTHRLLRDWNHTGDKWGNLPDIADWISEPERIVARSITMAFSLIGLVLILRKSSLLNPCLPNSFLPALAAVCIFAYRAAVGDVSMFYPYPSSRGIIEFQLFLFLLTLLLANGCYQAYKILIGYDTIQSWKNTNQRRKNDKDYQAEMIKMTALAIMTEQLCTVWILFCTSLKRPCDVPVVVIFIWSCHILTGSLVRRATTDQSTAHVSVLTKTYIWLGMVFYFHQGNSNSLASIDLQAGYVGKESYHPVAVGILLFCHTFSMPITSIVLLFHSLVSAPVRSNNFSTRFFQKALTTAGKSIAFARLLPVVIYLPLITIQRHHLFIWTVFSPKLLYEASLTLAALFGLTVLPVLELFVYIFIKSPI